MFHDIRTMLSRQDVHLIQDALGAASLIVILVAGLHLPGLI
ncbi:hypothetical protein [Pacificitalea manganoxidans]|nr:hypothetical protein [Pacificitalea manganoxidans]MDR6309372.1 hypothetical protein [Pacificitalea manganoxidans]|tara:strand:+ start:758 stop:880 length:123 start_codon:yes stop_codon:yes gene_type:complete